MRDWPAWLLAAAAMLPMVAVYALHFAIVPAGQTATGFLQGDQASYMGEGRAYFEHGFALTYGLPFSPDYDTPRIYFQTLIFLLGVLAHVSRLDLGVVYDAAGVLAGIAMFRVAIALYAQVNGRPRDVAGWLACLVFLWGGGIIALLGVLLVWLPSAPADHVWLPDALFAFDADGGWWFLNVGRNVYYTLESLYHVLFFGTIVLVLRRRYGLALLTILLTSSTHPFTASELLAVVVAFTAFDVLTRQPGAPPGAFLGGLVALLAVHLFYYLFVLGWLSPEHVLVERQNSLPWGITGKNIVAGYGPMMLLAAARLFWFGNPRELWRRPEVRLLVVWFAVTFCLANHELLIAPRQPAHFTRGYVWGPLALLALPLVEQGFRWAWQRRSKVVSVVLVVTMLGFALQDNLAWYARQYLLAAGRADHHAIYMSDDAKAVLARLGAPDMQGRLLLTNDQALAFLTTVYLPVRTWLSHNLNTPDAQRRREELQAFFGTGAEVPSWRSRPLVGVADRSADAHATERFTAAGFAPVVRVGQYEMLVREPR